MNIFDITASFHHSLTSALAQFDAGKLSRQGAYKKSLRLDYCLLIIYLSALFPSLYELLALNRSWGSADWILHIHLALILLLAGALQLRVFALDRQDEKDVPALMDLLSHTDLLCEDYRFAVEKNNIPLSSDERATLNNLESSLRRAQFRQDEVYRMFQSRGTLLRGACLLLVLCYGSFLLPIFFEGVAWDWSDWLYAFLMTAFAVGFLYAESALLFSALETRLLRRYLGIARLEIRSIAASFEQKAVDRDEAE